MWDIYAGMGRIGRGGGGPDPEGEPRLVGGGRMGGGLTQGG